MDGKSRCKQMQNYETDFVKCAAQAILASMERRWRQREVLQIFVSGASTRNTRQGDNGNQWHSTSHGISFQQLIEVGRLGQRTRLW